MGSREAGEGLSAASANAAADRRSSQVLPRVPPSAHRR